MYNKIITNVTVFENIFGLFFTVLNYVVCINARVLFQFKMNQYFTLLKTLLTYH